MRGFKDAVGKCHGLTNKALKEVFYLKIGDQTPGDQVGYPDNELKALRVSGQWTFAHNGGLPYR